MKSCHGQWRQQPVLLISQRGNAESHSEYYAVKPPGDAGQESPKQSFSGKRYILLKPKRFESCCCIHIRVPQFITSHGLPGKRSEILQPASLLSGEHAISNNG